MRFSTYQINMHVLTGCAMFRSSLPRVFGNAKHANQVCIMLVQTPNLAAIRPRDTKNLFVIRFSLIPYRLIHSMTILDFYDPHRKSSVRLNSNHRMSCNVIVEIKMTSWCPRSWTLIYWQVSSHLAFQVPSSVSQLGNWAGGWLWLGGWGWGCGWDCRPACGLRVEL